MNRWLETDIQKTSRSIINVLNESAAGMVKKEINKDKPEEAPKEEKVALEKRVTKAAIKGRKPESKNAKMPEKTAKKVVKEELEPETEKSIEDQIADLQDYLDNTPEVSDEERAEIQAEIDSLISQLGEDEVDDKIMNESAHGTDAYDKLVQGDDVYFRNEEGVALLGHYADNYPEPEEYDEGFKPEYGGTEEGLQKAKEAAANGDVWEFMEVFEDTLQPMNEVYAYVYGQDDLMEMLKTLRQVNVVKKLEENQIEDARKDSIEKGLISEEESEFKVGDVVKVPYKYGSYTPGEFTEAPIIDISEGRYVTVEIPSKLEVTMDQLKKWNTLGECDESLKEAYSDKLGGDPSDFVSDVETIKAKLSEIDTSGFGSHLAAQMVEDWIETCDYQIEKGKRLASGNEFYTESKKSKKIKHALKESEYYYNSDYDERLKYLIADIRDIKGFANLLISEFGESEPEEDDYNYEEGCHVVNVGGTTFYINKDLDDIWCYDDDPEFTMEELCNNANIYTFLEKEGLVSDYNEYEDEDDYDEDDLDEADDRTYKDRDEAEYYRNKELYANSNLARHREAMEKAKKACEEKGIKLDEDNYLSRTRKEEPLDLVAYKPEITSIDEVKDKYVKIRGDFHKVIDVKPEGDKFVISFAAGTGTAIGGEFEPATLDEIKRLQLYTENK